MFLRSGIKYPLIPVVSVLNLNTRLIHLSPLTSTRRKLLKFSDFEAKSQNFEKEKLVSPCTPNPNVNFYGIDSDEGVIVIDSKNSENDAEKNTSTISQKSKEKFFRSSFGVIRQDSDNEIRIHGQYDSAVSDAFPHKSTDFAEVSGNFQHVKSKLFNATNNDKISKIKHDENSYTGEYSYPNKENSCVTEGSTNYIDGYFFGDYIVASSEKSNLQSGEGHENFGGELFTPDKTGNSSKNLSIKDDDEASENFCRTKSKMFSALNNDKICELKQNDSNTSFTEDYSDSNPSMNENEANYIDECYFSDYSAAITEKSSLLPENNESQANFLDEIFFPHKSDNTTENLRIEDYDKININVLDNRESVNDKNFQQDKEAKFRFPVDDNIVPGSLSECTIAQDSCADSSIKCFTDGRNKSNSKDVYFHNSQINRDTSLDETLHPISFENTSKPHFSNISKAENKLAFSKNYDDILESQHSLNKQDSISDLEKSSEYFEKPNSVHHKSGISESVMSLNSNKRKIMLQNLKTPEHVGKTEISQPQSAYNFVTELRKKEESESKNQREINSGSSSIKSEKLDSKGFRILKNQVTDLSHFTREEVLNVLKKNIIYSDDNLLVLNKPYSLVIHESQTTKSACLSSFLDTLAKDLDQQSDNPKLFTVHRLDKETTGCMLLARNESMAQNLKSLFAQRKIIKKYWIVTARVPDLLKGVIDIPIAEGMINGKQRMVLHPDLPKDTLYRSFSKNGKRAVTSYNVLNISGNAALVEATPITGIKHQIRVHFGFGLSCPILGDHKYSHIDKLAPQKLASDLLQRLHVRQSKVRYIPMHIHSKCITIPNYFEERDLFVTAPLPHHMTSNLKKLKFKKKNKLDLRNLSTVENHL